MADSSTQSRIRDKAGRGYWNAQWRNLAGNARSAQNPSTPGIADRAMLELVESALEGLDRDHPCLKVVEVGCASSRVLAELAARRSMQVVGIDYSEEGCQSSRAIFQALGVGGEIVCADVFDLNERFHGSFNLVMSFGLIEHFEETEQIVAALARLLKPGGVIVSVVPNMCGVIGLMMRTLHPKVFSTHVPLDPKSLCRYHERVGLHAIRAGYYMSTNFGVLNVRGAVPDQENGFMKRLIVALLTRFSMAIWTLERVLGPLPVSQWLSPYVFCIAKISEK